MSAIIVTVFLASLLGSLHCVGMCGAFLGIACGNGRGAHAAYHVGRLLTYVGLGAIAGAAGQGIDLASDIAGIEPIAMLLSATTITIFGVVTWLRLKGIRLPVIQGPRFIGAISRRGYDVAMSRPPVQRAAIIGLLTTLLPCGWLWAFLVTAAGTAHPATAMLVMLVFWLGTLPAMALLGVGLRGALGAAQRRVPTIACAAMIAVGLFSIAGRARLDPASWARADTPATTQPSIHAVPPCCVEPEEHVHVDAR